MNNSKNNFNLGSNIKLLRKQKGLTQVQLAEIVGCSQAMITNYENNQKKPAIDTLAVLADALNVSIDELIGKKASSKKDDKIRNSRLLKKFEQVEELPSNDKRAVFKMIDGLVAQNKR